MLFLARVGEGDKGSWVRKENKGREYKHFREEGNENGKVEGVQRKKRGLH